NSIKNSKNKNLNIKIFKENLKLNNLKINMMNRKENQYFIDDM
mgnify:CR=1